MCGISGIISKNKNQLIAPSLLKTNDLLSHRGPDDEGYLFWDGDNGMACFGNATPKSMAEYHTLYSPKHSIQEAFNKPSQIGLAHRRLSILDLTSNGHQPMCLTDDLWIVYNGEIYNYIEVRETLIKKGYQFKTNSDTEVLLVAYKEWGINMLDRLNGMWAFVIWDKQNNKLFGSRDRFGVKPLYYTENSSLFAFASEIKALRHLTESNINKEGAWDYLITGKHETMRESLYSSINELKPSEYFIYDLQTNIYSIKNYYQLNYNTTWNKLSSVDIKKETEEIQYLLSEAIRLRLRSDVTLGASLSGGLDSSTIVSYILSMIHDKKKEVPDDVLHLFTAHFPDASNDEYEWAAKLAANSHSHWHIVNPNAEDFFKDLDDLIYTQDLPFFSMSVYSHYKLMQTFKKEGIKINFDGQGSDELFGGYQKHFNCFAWEAMQNNDISSLINNFQPPYFNSFNSPLKFIKQLSKKTIQNTHGFRYLFSHEEMSYFQPDFKKEYQYKTTEYNKQEQIQPLNQFLHQQFCGPDLKVLLRTGDRNSMRYGIETRTPFADDYLLIEKIFSLSASIKIQNGYSKYLLRESTKIVLPDAVRLRRDKVGYATPEIKWLKTIQHQLYDLITDQDDEFIQYSKLKKEWFSTLNTLSEPSRLWRIINFMRWRKISNI